MPWDIAVAAFGVTSALLLVGGAILLRFQRDRYHFLLMQSALSQGITAFPGAAPAWLVSLRVGMLALVLGLGLVGSGITLMGTTRFIDEAPANPGPATIANHPQYQNPDFRGPPPGPGMETPDRFESPQGPPPRNGPQGPRPGMRNDNNPGPPNVPQAGQNPPLPGQFPRPLANPQLERWHRVQTQRTTGIVTLCAGGILALLGLVRIAFARVERKYTLDAAPSASPSTAAT